MKNIFGILALFNFLLFPIIASSQMTHYCGTDHVFNQYLLDNPKLGVEREKLEQYAIQCENTEYKKSGNVKVIPIVFHVIHNFGGENISKNHILEGLRIINEDFRKQNIDTNIIVSTFKGIAADTEIEFRLAQLDPDGNCTDGITRTVSTLTHSADDNVKDLIRWPNNKYLNVWLVQNISFGAGGFAYYPGAGPDIDGIVLRSDQFGIGYRSLTHEIGHYLNLAHPWGSTNDPGVSSNCNIDDGVADTPNSEGNTSCNLAAVSCGSLDNVQNYMDYAFCECMFTEGQKTRMHAALNSSLSGRNNLWTPSNLSATGTDGTNYLCNVDFTASQKVVCQGSSVTFEDVSYNGQYAWSWHFPGGSPSVSILESPIVTYNTPGVYEVSLSVTDGNSVVAESKSAFITVQEMPGSSVPVLETFETLPTLENNWEVINFDNENTFELVDFAGYSGTKCAKMNNYANEMNRKDEFISPAYDLSEMESIELSFKIAFAQKIDTTNDILRIYKSKNCGKSWVPCWIGIGSDLATTAVQNWDYFPIGTPDWEEHIVTNFGQDYAVSGFRFKFEFVNGGGNNLFIDDINVSGYSSTIPMLVSPENTSSEIPIAVKLDWNAVENVDFYEYQLDTSLAFSSPVLETGTNQYLGFSDSNTDTETDISGLNGQTTYYWRVRSSTSSVYSTWTSVWEFQTVNSTSINNIEFGQDDIEMKILPNPLTELTMLSLYLKKDASNVSYTITDLLGRELAVEDIGSFKKASSLKVPLAKYLVNQKDGVYFVVLKVDGIIQAQKMVKQ